MNNLIEIYTDGSHIPDQTELSGCGWAYIIPKLNVNMFGKVYEENGNISRMELTAILEAIRYVADHKGHYVIYCDNLPIVKCFKGLGTRKLYKDIWHQIYVLLNQAREIGSTITIEFLNRKELDQQSQTFKYAQLVDKLAFTQANSLCIF